MSFQFGIVALLSFQTVFQFLSPVYRQIIVAFQCSSQKLHSILNQFDNHFVFLPKMNRRNKTPITQLKVQNYSKYDEYLGICMKNQQIVFI